MKYLLTLLVIFCSNIFYAQDITQGLVGHWLMNDEDELEDQSPSGIYGFVSSGVFTEDRFGNEEEAIYFDGQFDYAVLADALDEVTTVDNATFSISLWHRTADLIPDLSPLMCKYSHSLCGEVQRQWALLIANGEGIRFYYASTPDNSAYRSISTLETVANELETWYHIVATYDGSIDSNDGQDRVQIYVDNVLQEDTLNFNPGELGETIYDGDAPIGLMSYVNTDEGACGDFHAPGALDDVRIYDRVISEEEVGLLFEEGVLGVDELQLFDNSLMIAPNIIENQSLTIRAAQTYAELEVEILSSRGELVQTSSIKDLNGQVTVALENVSAGAYMVKLRSKDGLETTKRFVIR